MSTTDTAQTQQAERTLQVYRVYIKVAPEKVWQAITDPEWNGRYGYGAPQFFELRPGGSYRSTASEEMRKVSDEMGYGIPDVVVDGEVIEADPPRKLVQTWRMLMDPELEAEGFTRLTHEIEPIEGGSTKLTIIHELEGAPRLANLVSGGLEGTGAGGGWAWVLSDLKSVLETGKPLAG
jgi:uncharacterized protein YndB with AHSA1/START domain